MELHQKTLLENRSFFLLPNQIKLYLKDVEGECVNYISYESLQENVQMYRCKNPKLLFIIMATMSFTLGTLLHIVLTNEGLIFIVFPLILTIISVLLYQTQQRKYIIVETFERSKIVFCHNKPNQKALEKFLTQLWIQRRKYLRAKYFYISQNNYTPQKQTDRLRWLLEQNIITQSEFRFAEEDWIIDRSYQSKC